MFIKHEVAMAFGAVIKIYLSLLIILWNVFNFKYCVFLRIEYKSKNIFIQINLWVFTQNSFYYQQ